MTGSSLPNTSAAPIAGVSVVIPAHNYAQYLPLTLRSVLEQTFTHFEIVVVDDGSTDGTREVVASVAASDPRVRYVWQENAGLSAARNTGIRESSRPFVAFLDADDLWEPGLLAEVMRVFGELSPDYALVATSSSRIDAEGAPFPPPKRNWDRDREYTARDFCLRNRPLSSSVVLRREVFERVGFFDTGLRSSEDRDMWIRATAAGFRFWFIHQPLCRIRRHRGNMSKHAPRMHANSSAVLRAAWRRCAVPRDDIPFWLRVFAVHYQQVATTHFDGGYRARAFGYLALSVLHWPFFANHRAVGEPSFFRIRTLVHFLARSLRGSHP